MVLDSIGMNAIASRKKETLAVRWFLIAVKLVFLAECRGRLKE
jgi:hypothetical protein